MNVTKWKYFDYDTMDKGAAILSNKSLIKRRSTQIEQITGTEATNPTHLDSRKQKRHPEKWKISLRKKVVNSGQQYSFEIKKRNGEVSTKKSK